MLGDGVGRETEIGRALVRVGELNREGFGVVLAATVGDAHGDRMAGGAFIVEQAAVGDRELARTRIDGKPPPGRIGEAIGLRVTGIGIRARDGAHHRAGGGVLGDGVGRETEIGRALVDVGHCDSNSLCIGTTIPIGNLHRHIVDIVTTTIRW